MQETASQCKGYITEQGLDRIQFLFLGPSSGVVIINMVRDWWFKDNKMLALWHKIHNMTPEEFANVDPKVKAEIKYWYGNIFFFKPYPAQKPILDDNAFSVYIHGNNSSGKSYVACLLYTSPSPRDS